MRGISGLLAAIPSFEVVRAVLGAVRSDQLQRGTVGPSRVFMQALLQPTGFFGHVLSLTSLWSRQRSDPERIGGPLCWHEVLHPAVEDTGGEVQHRTPSITA